jgi:hypothetical protein
MINLLTDSFFGSMFKEPESSPERAIDKVERTAASSRSAIRRERTTRDADTENSRRSGERIAYYVPGGRHTATTDLLSQARPRNRTNTQSENRDAPDLASGVWGSMFEAARHGDEQGIRNAVRMQVDEELRLSPSAHTQHPTQSATTSRRQRARPGAAWLSGSYYAAHLSALNEQSVEEQALLARPYMPSPPYSFSDNTATGLRPRGTDGNIIAAEPTPGFAPAQGEYRDNREREPAIHSSAPRHHTPPGESSWTASYPPLRRVSHFSPRPAPNIFSLAENSRLGGRRHSVSSSSEVEHDTWETLLTTMEPDTHLPSSDSSFTSATASQSTIRPQNTSVSQNTSFASATTATPPNPTNAGEPEMDLEIGSTQYEGLSGESRGSMRSMLDIIRNARQIRNSNPLRDIAEFLRPQRNERPSLASRRQTARQYLTIAELRQQDDENRILSNYLTTLREMDELRATANIRARRIGNTNMTARQRAHQYTSDNPNRTGNINNENVNRQPRFAQDLLRTMEHQTRQIARELQDMQETETPPASGPEQQSRAASPVSTAMAEEMENVQRAIQRARTTDFSASYRDAA